MSAPARPEDLLDWLRLELLNRRPQPTQTPNGRKPA